MESSHNTSKGTFFSSGGPGYRAPSPRKPNIKEVVQHVRQCRDEMTRNVIILQQAALEQERLEAYFEQLAAATQTLIEVMQEPGEGTVLTGEWMQRRDEVIKVVRMILGQEQQDETQAQKHGKEQNELDRSVDHGSHF
jgi:hypothetical protein